MSLATLAWLPPAASADVSFAPAVDYPVTHYAGGIVAEDFDADGDLDLAVVNGGGTPSTVSILLGAGDGSFGAPVKYPVGGGAAYMASADFNGDGDPDLAVTNYIRGSVSILQGGAGGTFGDLHLIPVGLDPFPIAIEDLNGDLDPDLIIGHADYHVGGVSVLLGGPRASFGPATNFPAGFGSQALALDDFDGDGNSDVAVADYGGGGGGLVSVLLGGGDGSFGPATDYRNGGDFSTTFSNGIAAGDFDGDGNPDLAASGPATDISVRLGRGDGTFRGRVAYGAGGIPGDIVDTDLDLDGDVDPAIATRPNWTGGVVAVLPGGPGGIFGAYKGFPVAPGPDAITGGDFDEDGDVDLATSSASFPSFVSVLLNKATAVYATPSSITWPQQPDSTSRSRRVTLTNESTSTGDLAISGVALAGADTSSFRLPAAYDECTGTTVPSGGSCQVEVRFSPDGVGPKTARLEFADDALVSPQVVDLAGTGTPGPWLTRSVLTLKFGHVGVGNATTPKSVTLTNTGSASMQIASVAVDGADRDDFVGLSESCTTLVSLEPDQSCEVQVAFRPSATGQRRAHLTIEDSAPRSPHRVRLRGTGT